MSTITKSVDVDVPVTTAYNQWTQMESFPRFMSNVESVEQRDDTTMHWVVDIGGVRREFDAHIDSQSPDDHVSWSALGELVHEGRVDFEPLGPTQTRVNVTMRWEPEGFTENVGDALGIDDRVVESDLQRFKELIEERGVEEGAWRGEI